MRFPVLEFKGPLSGLRQFLTLESSKNDEKCFLFYVNTSFCSSDIFILVLTENILDQNAMVDFKVYDVTDWTKNNYNTQITQYLKN